MSAARLYTEAHEWVDYDAASGTAAIGITAYAAEQLGDIVYLELPQPGDTARAGVVLGEIESTKSVGELYAPVDGRVERVNTEAADDPAIVNAAADETWLVVLSVDEAPAGLLDADAYAALTEQA